MKNILRLIQRLILGKELYAHHIRTLELHRKSDKLLKEVESFILSVKK